MKLIDKDALVAKLKRIEHETNYEPFTGEVLGKRYACKSLLSFINTLEVKEVQEEPVSEDLEIAAHQCYEVNDTFMDGFKKGAKWQLNKIRGKYEKNRD